MITLQDRIKQKLAQAKLAQSGVKIPTPAENSVQSAKDMYNGRSYNVFDATFTPTNPSIQSATPQRVEPSTTIPQRKSGADYLADAGNVSGKFLGGVSAVMSFPIAVLEGAQKAITASPYIASSLIKGDTKKAIQDYSNYGKTIGGVIKEGFQSTADMADPKLKQSVGYQFASELIGDLSDAGVAAVTLGGIGNKLATKNVNIKITPEELSGKVPFKSADARMVAERLNNNLENFASNPANTDKMEQFNHMVEQIKQKGITIKGEKPGNIFNQFLNKTLFQGPEASIKGSIEVPNYEGFSSKTKLNARPETPGGVPGTMLTSREQLPELATPNEPLRLKTGENTRTSITPVNTEQASFQIYNQTKLASLKRQQSELAKIIKQKSDLFSGGRATKDTATQLKVLQKLQAKVEEKIQETTKQALSVTGPIKNEALQAPVSNKIQESTQSTVIELPGRSKAPVAEFGASSAKPPFESVAEALKDPEYSARIREATKQLKQKRVTKTSNNLYHTTSADNLANITKEGLKPNQTEINNKIVIGSNVKINKGLEKGETGIVESVYGDVISIDVPARAAKGKNTIGLYRLNNIEKIEQPAIKKEDALSKAKRVYNETRKKLEEKTTTKNKEIEKEEKTLEKTTKIIKKKELEDSIMDARKDLNAELYHRSLKAMVKDGMKEADLKKLYEKEFDAEVGKEPRFSKASIIFDFMENEYGFVKTANLLTPIKQIETFLNKKAEDALTFIYSKSGAKTLQNVIVSAVEDMKVVKTLGKALVYEYRLPQWYKDLKRMRDSDIIKTQNLAREFYDNLSSGLNNEQKFELQKAIQNGGKHPNYDIEARASVARKVIDDMGDAFWRVGGIPKEIYEKNKGEYIARVYLPHELEDSVSRFYSSGKSKADLKRTLKRGIEKTVPEQSVSNYTSKGWEYRGEVKNRKGYYKVWRDYTQEERTKMGELVNAPEYTVAKTVMDVGMDKARLEMFSKIADNPNWVSKSELPGWKRIPEDKRYGVLSGKYVDEFIHNDIVGIVEAKTLGEDMFSRLLSEWKKFKVVDNPSTHFRNMYFNFMLSDLAGLSPTRVDIYVEALRGVKNESALYKEARDAGVFGSSWTRNELRSQLKPPVSIEGKKDVMDLLSGLGDLYGKTQNKLSGVYQAEEEWNKLALYIYAKEQGMDTMKAAEFAKYWGLDYGAVTPFVSRLSLKWYGAPFIRFKVKAAPVLIKSLHSRMFTLMKWAALGYGVAEASRKALDMTKDEYSDLKKLFQDYYKGGLYIPLPGKDKYGNYQFIDMTYVIPFSQEVQGKWRLADYLFGNPGFIAATELMTNQDSFTGKDVYTPDEDPAITEAIETWAQHYYKNLMPSLAIGNWNYEKLKRAALGGKDYSGRSLSLLSAIGSTIFGIKLIQINPDANKQDKLVELKKKYQEVEKNGFVAQNDQSLTDEERKKKLEKIMNDAQIILKEASEIQDIDTTIFNKE